MASTVSPTNPNLVIDPKISRRGKYLIPEIAVAPGPIDLDIGTGAYQNLFGYVWAAAISKDNKIKLFQDDGFGWKFVQLIEDTPITPDRMRHISLAFDQAGKPMIAFEHEGADQVYVRQWDGLTSRYTYRGPFDGVDPVLLNDATINGDIAGSDIIMFYLAPDRMSVKMRIQRDKYTTEYDVYRSNLPAYLDQAVDGGLRIELLGSLSNAQDQSSLVVNSKTYPVKQIDDFPPVNAIAPDAADYRSIIVTYDGGIDSFPTINAVPPANADYRSIIVTYDGGIDSFPTINAVPPANADYRSILITYDGGVDALSTANAVAPANGLYKRVVSAYSGGVDTFTTASAAAPAGGSYVPG